jgi:hypothetical protein
MILLILFSTLFFLFLFFIIDFFKKPNHIDTHSDIDIHSDTKREFGTITIEKNKDTIIDDSIIKEIPELNNDDDVLIEE